MTTLSPTKSSDRSLRFARMVKRVMDDAHIDPIVGFVFPVLGDVVTGLFGLSLVVIAWRRAVPAVTIARMLLNLALDAGLGAIPVLGDAFDFYFRANTRNLALLEARTHQRHGALVDATVVICAGLCFLAALALPIFIGVKLVAMLLRAG